MVSVVSHGVVVGPTCQAGLPNVMGPGRAPRAVLAWQGAGRIGRAVTKRNTREKKSCTKWDMSRLTGADNASNRMRNKDVCEP